MQLTKLCERWGLNRYYTTLITKGLRLAILLSTRERPNDEVKATTKSWIRKKNEIIFQGRNVGRKVLTFTGNILKTIDMIIELKIAL